MSPIPKSERLFMRKIRAEALTTRNKNQEGKNNENL